MRLGSLTQLGSILIIRGCIADCPQARNKVKRVLFHKVSEGQESGSDLHRWF